MSRSSTPVVSSTVASSQPVGGLDEKHKAETAGLDFAFLPIPARLRYHSERPVHFGLALNIAFGIGSTFIVANLYYCQPLLIQMSDTFGATYNEVSRIPTLIQAGYATGLLLISPLGDLVRRRPLVLILIFVTTGLTIGLSITRSLAVFEALCFLVGTASVVPQVLIPLAADLAPPERRASAISIVFAGMLFGVLLARVISGVIAEFVTWRVVYYMAIGTQAAVLVGAYSFLPDYPAKNAHMTYFGILGTMAKYCVTEPLLVQGSIILFAASACFSNFWVTLTFLLGGAPYHYSTLDIGLFGLVGMFGVSVSPLAGRLIDRVVPYYATMITICVGLLFQTIQLGAGGINIAAVIITVFGMDVCQQSEQVAVTTAIFGIEPAARARLNAVIIISIFLGQVMGTSVGTTLFVKYGWRGSAGLSVGLIGCELLVLLARGPHVPRHTWLGYDGGWEARKSVVEKTNRESIDEGAATLRSSEEGKVEKGPKEGNVEGAEQSAETPQRDRSISDNHPV